jgi:uncharacterized protein HemY
LNRVIVLLFFVVVGIALALALTLVFQRVPFLRENEVVGTSLGGVLAIIVALPMADWVRKKVFGPRSFGERP